MVFSSSHVWMWELDYKEGWAPKNWCFWTVVLEKTLKSPLDCKEIQPVYPKGDQSWIFTGRTDAETETPIHWPPDEKNWFIWKDRCWERLKAGGEQDERGWDGWMASPTQWTWVWINSRSWWWTGKPGVLQSMGSQRVRHDWATELNWTEFLNTLRGINFMGGELSWDRIRYLHRRQCFLQHQVHSNKKKKNKKNNRSNLNVHPLGIAQITYNAPKPGCSAAMKDDEKSTFISMESCDS